MMQPLRFDIAVIGGSLAARMTAALLAKHGKRLLLFINPAPRDPWQNASLFLEHLLGVLGGRDILTANQPFQVLTNRARITIHTDIPLARELDREFGETAPAVRKLLDELEYSGRQLEEVLWEFGGLPRTGLREAAAWRWLCLRRKVSPARLNEPLARRLQGFPEHAADWLRSLFQGLALQPLETLTFADGALLWSQARRTTGLSAESLSGLLNKRFEQFHGVEVSTGALIRLEPGHGHWICCLEGGKRFQADHLILGDMDLPPSGLSHKASRSRPASKFASAAVTDGRVSALFEKRVIVGGPLPLRLVLCGIPATPQIDIGTHAAATETGIRCQLDPFLPFSTYSLDVIPPARHDSMAGGSASLFKCPLHLGSHLWCADATFLFPQLGNGGAAPVAWTLARQFDPALAAHPGGAA